MGFSPISGQIQRYFDSVGCSKSDRFGKSDQRILCVNSHSDGGIRGLVVFWYIYGPNNASLRFSFWDELAGLQEISGDNWCLGRDFNVVRSIDEKANSPTFTRSMRMLDELINEMELIDPPLSNASYTWSNFKEIPICCRLDRYLFSANFGDLFEYIRQEVAVRSVSDHCPIILSTNLPSWGSTPFRFENMWLEHRQFKDYFSGWWREEQTHGWAGYKFMRKLKNIRPHLKSWNLEVFGDLRLEKTKLCKRIMEIDETEGSIGLMI